MDKQTDVPNLSAEVLAKLHNLLKEFCLVHKIHLQQTAFVWPGLILNWRTWSFNRHMAGWMHYFWLSSKKYLFNSSKKLPKFLNRYLSLVPYQGRSESNVPKTWLWLFCNIWAFSFKNIPATSLKVYLSKRYPDDMKDLMLTVDLMMRMLKWFLVMELKPLLPWNPSCRMTVLNK